MCFYLVLFQTRQEFVDQFDPYFEEYIEPKNKSEALSEYQRVMKNKKSNQTKINIPKFYDSPLANTRNFMLEERFGPLLAHVTILFFYAARTV